jgi:hypothetical protein
MSKIKINPDSLKSRREWKRHKVKDGNNIFRFLPPLGEQSNGYPYRKWNIIWGLLDPENGRKRPYASSLSSEKRCPVVEYVKALTEKAKTIEAELKASGASEEAIKKRLAPLNKVISNVRPKGVYAWNAVDKSGVVGLIELKSTAHKKLKSLMNDYLSMYNQDPTSVNSDEDDSGVWFNVKRSGAMFNTEYDVEKVQTRQKIDGRLAFVDDMSPLPEDVVLNWENLAYDLSSIYQTKSYEELKDILLANMSSLLEECPDALVSGFEPSGDVTLSDDLGEAASSRAEVPPSQGRTAVTTKFDDNDDEDDEDVVLSTKSSARTTLADPDEDIFAMADDILNS